MMSFFLDWIWWIVGFGSFAGLIAMVALFFLAYPLFQSVMAVLTGMLEWFKTPVGQIVGVVILIVLIFSAGWQSGGNKARRDCAEGKSRAELAVRKADSDTAVKMAVEDGVISGEIDVEQVKTEGLINAYRKKLREQREKQPPDQHGPGCILTDDDIESLRLGGD